MTQGTPAKKRRRFADLSRRQQAELIVEKQAQDIKRLNGRIDEITGHFARHLERWRDIMQTAESDTRNPAASLKEANARLAGLNEAFKIGVDGLNKPEAQYLIDNYADKPEEEILQ